MIGNIYLGYYNNGFKSRISLLRGVRGSSRVYLRKFVRNQVLFANTLFKSVCYNLDESQVVTSGTDRKVAYWECFDGNKIRVLEGSKSGSVNGIDLSKKGGQFVTGGDDKLIKVWQYNEGIVTHVGVGHSGCINSVKICPNDKFVVSVSSDGAILVWEFPSSTDIAA